MSNQSDLGEFDVLDTGETERDPVEDKLYRDEEWLRKQYCENGLTQSEIADKAGVSEKTIGNWIRKNEIETRSPAESRTDGDLELVRDEDWLRKQYCGNGLTISEIADKAGVGTTTVRRSMDKYEIEARSPAESRTDGNLELLNNEEWMREQYCERMKTQYEIADMADASQSVVRKRMKEYGIDTRGTTAGNFELLNDEEWMREQYCEREKVMSEIADMADVSTSTVHKMIHEHAIESRRSGNELLKDEEWMREQYWEQEKSTFEIADALNVNQKSVMDWMKRLEIERRSLAESHTDGDIELLKDREWMHEQYCEQQKTTYEIANELNVSRPAVAQHLKRHNIEVRSSVMYPDDLPHRVIGELELYVARRLRDGGINYEYESEADEIEYGEDRTYKPDFSTDDYVIECKGTDWGKEFSKGHTAEQKAEAAMSQLDERESVPHKAR